MKDVRMERALVLAAQAGDRRAMGDLLSGNAGLIDSVLRRRGVPAHDRADVASAVQVEALEAFAGFDPARGEFGRWYACIAEDVAGDYRQRQELEARIAHRVETSELAGYGRSPERPDDALERAQTSRELRRRIGALPAAQRTLIGHQLDETSYEQIAAAHGRSPGGARVTMARAVASLRAAMAGPVPANDNARASNASLTTAATNGGAL